ncbi:helix-turn-helix domain-containing protein [Streptosporangiaceae bacterium NEAU-GS5]|nr:helix-turn-helix domain-containing protein [Streptosporangiaceae bacterium NEAU-GS5]
MQEYADEIARVLDASVTIEDRAFQLLAYGAHSGDIDPVREASILHRRASAEVKAHFEAYGIATATGPVRIPGIDGLLGRVCVPLRHGGVTYGYLWLLDSGDLTSGRLTDERLAAIESIVRRAAAALAREAKARHAPLRDLLSPDPDSPLPETNGPVAAIAVRNDEDRAAALWTLPRGVLADPAFADDLTALLAPAAQAAEVAGKVQAMYGTAVGVGDPREDPAQAWESWREAVLALRVAERVDRHGPVARYAGLGVYRLLARQSRAELTETARIATGLGDLAETVETYLDHAGHAQQTATRLGVHRQTLYYRLAKAGQLTGLDLADGEDRLVLHLALKAGHLV